MRRATNGHDEARARRGTTHAPIVALTRVVLDVWAVAAHIVGPIARGRHEALHAVARDDGGVEGDVEDDMAGRRDARNEGDVGEEVPRVVICSTLTQRRDAVRAWKRGRRLRLKTTMSQMT